MPSASRDRKSTRLNSSHSSISYAVFCLKKKIGKTYPNGVHTLERISLTVAPGEILVVLGGSSCGKSTMLRAISGLDTLSYFFFKDAAATETYTLSLHDALPI